MRIVTVTPNPALDRNLLLDAVHVDAIQVARSVVITAGGKGLNVARVLRTLGASVVATGFLGGAVGREIAALLDDEGITQDFVDISPAETRMATILISSGGSAETVINERGPSLSEVDAKALCAKLAELLDDAAWVVFSGSLPPGIPKNLYALLITDAHVRGAKTLLDSSGEALRYGIQAKPTVLKTNASELRALNLIDDSVWDREVSVAAQSIRRILGIPILAVTLGEGGSALDAKSGTFSADAPIIKRVCTLGSGDAFAAGLVYVLSQNYDDLAGALELAGRCGAANAGVIGAGACNMTQINALSGRIKIENFA